MAEVEAFIAGYSPQYSKQVASTTIAVSRWSSLELRFGFTFEIGKIDAHCSFGRLGSAVGNT